MGSKTSIEWTRDRNGTAGATWTPIRARHKATGKLGWHCEHASPGCINCYSEVLNQRWGTGLPFKPGHRDDVGVFLDETMLLTPLRWAKPRKIFVCSMTDLFADFVPDDWIDRIFAVMALAPRHTFQVLTKRSARMRSYVNDLSQERRDSRGTEVIRLGGITDGLRWPLPNVWLGVSAEDQERADERIPDLLATPAAVRFVSYEPALGPVDFTDINVSDGNTKSLDALSGDVFLPGNAGQSSQTFRASRNRLDWIIYGGESGPNRRDSKIEWAEVTMAACAATGTAFFFKQDSALRSGHRGRASDALWACKQFPRVTK
jgi:protein gp37